MKRGSTDVDWVIAIGIFITFLLSIFVFLKPGITPPHRPEALLDIVETNIKNETQVGGPGIYWTLYEVPLYLKKDSSVVGDDCFKIPFAYGWSQDKFDLYKIGDPNNPLDINKENPFAFKIEGDYIIFKPSLLTTNKEVFVIDYSENIAFSERAGSSHDVGCATDESGNDILIEEKDILDQSKINFEYSYGVIESVKGISIRMFEWGINEAKKSNSNFYNNLKQKMGFPQLKEFSVHITTTKTPPPQLCDSKPECNFQPVQPEVDANVFIREWSDFILNYNGLRDPVIVNIRVW